MGRPEIDAAVARLLEVVTRLLNAPDVTREYAAEYEQRLIAAGQTAIGAANHQVGGLEQVCRNEASQIRAIVDAYLATKVRKRGGR